MRATPQAVTKELAHLGLRQPLSDPALSCAGCHVDDASARAERYLPVAVSSAPAPPTGATNPTTAAPLRSSTANHDSPSRSSARCWCGSARASLAAAAVASPSRGRRALARGVSVHGRHVRRSCVALVPREGLGFATSAPIPPTSILANVGGGVLFGVGMATAGYCPGTIVAEAGEGRLDAWVADLSGLLVGAIVFGLL
jgi:hypothetical protein